MIKRAAATIMVALGVAAGTLAIAQPASAAPANYYCNYGPSQDNCYFYYSHMAGAQGGILPAVADLTTYTFSSSQTAPGAGAVLGANSMSGINGDSVNCVHIWSAVNYTGNQLFLNKYGVGVYTSYDFGVVSNANRSQSWGC
ncbi:MAG: hypothetical protein HOV77_18010 [Hamadaea sp.]|uniref:hypothetical protein n=1 Tax=Hamadaea sp. TaxID=2024425 RepID=UPI001837CDF2|nr:hypothetical protein [Hamadaea sp.]NUT21079.1 hypothetical protein [Hamadaea sp.]